jgi:GGDEF domain-containing protein
MSGSEGAVLVIGKGRLPILEVWAEERGLAVETMEQAEGVFLRCITAQPRLLLLGPDMLDQGRRLVRDLKADSFTAVVPVAQVTGESPEALREAFAVGVDEVLRQGAPAWEWTARLDALLSRLESGVQVHPSTRLPGTVAIEAEIAKRMSAGERFAVCYADLDYFKEYNDRYGYHEGDRVIRLLARILHDVVKGMLGQAGFVGHIGGDDFIFIIPAESVSSVCEEVVELFDLLAPYQYSEADRRAGYFFGKDRRGQLHRVPLMSLSIGVVSNERRHFTTVSQVSELATEMKSYAKTIAGSVYAVDRRQDRLGAGNDAEAVASKPILNPAQE